MSETEFLTRTGWATASKLLLTGDASGRKYTRLSMANRRAILMDEGPGSTPQLSRFAKIARHLVSLGLSAPEILAEDSDQFLLIEDLGDAVFARFIERHPDQETTLYKAAIDALIVSQNGPIPDDIAPYQAKEMTKAIDLLFEWYPTPKNQYSSADSSKIAALLEDILTEHLTADPVLIQRDFHAENLIWLPNRSGPARAGLLDFQDAVYGDPAYDMASLLVDARRDVSPDQKLRMIDYYVERTGVDKNAFATAFALCSAQRNLRILGIFSRLAIRDRKTSYVDLIPRVWSNLQIDLMHPALSDLKNALGILPEPTTDVLTNIRAAHV